MNSNRKREKEIPPWLPDILAEVKTKPDFSYCHYIPYLVKL